jgi:hypothetical protein
LIYTRRGHKMPQFCQCALIAARQDRADLTNSLRARNQVQLKRGKITRFSCRL